VCCRQGLKGTDARRDEKGGSKDLHVVAVSENANLLCDVMDR
jgi:hypothetical protein